MVKKEKQKNETDLFKIMTKKRKIKFIKHIRDLSMQ